MSALDSAGRFSNWSDWEARKGEQLCAINALLVVCCFGHFQHGFAQIYSFHYLMYNAVVYCALLFVCLHLSTYGMWQYNVIVPFYETERKRNDLFRCTKHPIRLNETDGGSKTIKKRSQNDSSLNKTMTNDSRPVAALSCAVATPSCPVATATSRPVATATSRV